jgi:predicted permease
MGYYWDARPVFVDGRRTPPDEQPPSVPCNYVGSTYFETMRIPIARGRAFGDADQAHTPLVAVINETMAERFWPNQDPIGRHFRSDSSDAPPLEVVGVAHDAKYISIFEQPQAYFYVPLTQHHTSMQVLHVRSTVPPDLLRPQLEREIHAAGADVPIVDAQTMENALMGFGGLMLVRLAAIQAGAMGALGLLLAVIGVYGVASYGAAQRTREIGIRMALGAASRDVLRLILGQGAVTVAVGVISGLLGAVGVGYALARAIQMKNAIDLILFATVSVLMAFVALAACYLPARRAMRVSPTVALRHE